MDKAGYDGIGPHKTAHKDFLSKIKGLSAPLSDATIDYAKDWSVLSIILTLQAKIYFQTDIFAVTKW